MKVYAVYHAYDYYGENLKWLFTDKETAIAAARAYAKKEKLNMIFDTYHEYDSNDYLVRLRSSNKEIYVKEHDVVETKLKQEERWKQDY